MPRFARLNTLIAIKEVGVIPIFYNSDIQTCINIVKACTDGGARCIEMTNRADRAIDVFSKVEEYCSKELSQTIMGAGSIVDAQTASAYINAGANFIVGPILDEETAIICNKRKIPYSPGCATATEIQKAHSFGVEYCKVFPGKQVGGPEFVKAILAPCPWTQIIPTGGVEATEESLHEWFKAGVACIGMGSNIITKEIIKNKDFDKLAQDVKKVIDTIKKIRLKLNQN